MQRAANIIQISFIFSFKNLLFNNKHLINKIANKTTQLYNYPKHEYPLKVLQEEYMKFIIFNFITYYFHTKIAIMLIKIYIINFKLILINKSA